MQDILKLSPALKKTEMESFAALIVAKLSILDICRGLSCASDNEYCLYFAGIRSPESGEDPVKTNK